MSTSDIFTKRARKLIDGLPPPPSPFRPLAELLLSQEEREQVNALYEKRGESTLPEFVRNLDNSEWRFVRGLIMRYIEGENQDDPDAMFTRFFAISEESIPGHEDATYYDGTLMYRTQFRNDRALVQRHLDLDNTTSEDAATVRRWVELYG